MMGDLSQPVGTSLGPGAALPTPAPPLPRWGPLHWTFFGLLAAACAFSRLYNLDDKALMHDESLFVYYTEYQLHRAWMYNYMPILHGPLMIEMQAVVFHVFGDTTYTMRLGCALLGVAAFFLLWRLRPWFGEAGTWAALVFFTVSTGMAYYERFFRNDALFMTLSLLIILCACNWYRTGSARWLVGLVVSVTLIFCNKENCVMLYFSGVTFLLFWAIQDAVQWFLKGKSGRVLAPSGLATPRPARVPNVFWFNVVLWAFLILVLTRTFEGIRFDADVASAIKRDYPLKDVRSLKLLLGILPAGVDSANLAKMRWFETPMGWRLFYGLGFLATLAGLAIFKAFVKFELGHREVLVRFWNGIARNAWWFLGAAALSLFLYLGIFTTWYANPRGPFKIYKDTFGYWLGQHEWMRIGGPFHYQMVIALIYELPAVLLMLGGWMVAMGRTRWGRAFALPILGLVTLLAVLYFNSAEWNLFLVSPVKDALGQQKWATGQAMLLEKLKLNSGVHLYLIFFLSYVCVVLTWAALWRGQIFHAWLIWWAVSSIGAYSFAGEKVPWVGCHMMLPIVLLGASYTGKLWNSRWARLHPAWFFVILGVFVLWNAKAMINACFRNNDDARERIVYGHTSKDLKDHADAVIGYWKRASIRLDWQKNNNDMTKLKDVKVLVKATDAAIWPLRWYLRDIDWTEHDDLAKAQEKYPFVFLEVRDLEKYPNIKENYTIYRGRGRCFWQPQLPEWKRLVDLWLTLVPRQYLEGQPIDARAKDAKSEWNKITDYLLFRNTFEKVGAPYPSVSSVDYYFCVRKDVDL